MESTEDSSEKGFLCLSLEQVIVSERGDHILIPHKALFEGSLTAKRQSKHKRRRSSRHSSVFEASDLVTKRSSFKHTSEQDFERRDSKVSFCEATTTRPNINMPPSPPQTPTSSSVYSRSVYSRSVMDSPPAPRKRNGRIIPHFPRYGQSFTKYPRRPRINNVHDIPGRHDGERMAFVHEKDDQSPGRFNEAYDPEIDSAVRPKSAVKPRHIAKKAAPEVPFDAVPSAFVDAHFGFSCITNSLSHLLTCGHTICTATPEVCASNCKGSHDSAQIRDRDTPFECMTCLTDHIFDMQYGRLTMYTAEVTDCAKATGQSSDWIQHKIAFKRLGWEDEDLEEMKSLCEKAKARHCRALWIEPEMQDLVDTMNKARQTATRGSQYASPTWTQMPIPEASTPQSRISMEERANSPRNSVSSMLTVESRTPSLRQSVTKLFARREKKESPVTQPPPLLHDDATSVTSTTRYAQDDEHEPEEVTMEFERSEDEQRWRYDVPPKSRPKTGQLVIREAG